MRVPTTPQTIAILLLATLTVPSTAQATPQTIATMRNHRRIILIATPHTNDPQAAAQNAILTQWKKPADDRDISVVTIAGTTVAGTTDTADALRRRYRLPSASFEVLLIGKDGHVAMRSAHPITADQLRDTIDAMPMRQAGER